MPQPPITLTLTVLILVASGCADDPAGGGGTTGTGGADTTTSGSTTTDDGADETGAQGVCLDVLGSIGSRASAYPLSLFVTSSEYRHSLDGVVCDGESDFFVYEAPCAGYLGFELRASNFLDQSDNVSLVLTDEAQQELVVSNGSTTTGAHRMELAHQSVTAGNYTVEVRHQGGDRVTYELTTYFLPAATCLAADWTCPADSTLVATRTACADEPPTSGVCATPDIVTTTVPLPVVGVGGEAFDGWVVTTTADEIRYHTQPSTAELALLAARCEQACEAQWSDNPFVTANCTAGFSTPTLWNRPGLPALALIPPALQDGSGLFAGQTLACNLHDTCASEFDEALAVARPTRVTPAPQPLGTGQEWSLTVDGATTADSSFATAPTVGAMTGTIGYSLCTAGDGADCPFYLGSLHLELSAPLMIDLDCGAGTQTHEIADLEIDLAQQLVTCA